MCREYSCYSLGIFIFFNWVILWISNIFLLCVGEGESSFLTTVNSTTLWGNVGKLNYSSSVTLSILKISLWSSVPWYLVNNSLYQTSLRFQANGLFAWNKKPGTNVLWFLFLFFTIKRQETQKIVFSLKLIPVDYGSSDVKFWGKSLIISLSGHIKFISVRLSSVIYVRRNLKSTWYLHWLFLFSFLLVHNIKRYSTLGKLQQSQWHPHTSKKIIRVLLYSNDCTLTEALQRMLIVSHYSNLWLL